MAQPSEIYVDPSVAADSGAGTAGDPFGDLEYGIEQTTFDTTNGTRVNIKAGADEVLAAEISTAMADTGTTIAWVPVEAAPCVFQGYTTVAGDGGKGGISGGGSVSVYSNATRDFINFIDLHCHNTGSAAVLDADNNISVLRCEIDNTTGSGLLLDLSGVVMGCHVHNCGAIGIECLSGFVAFNFLENGTNDFSTAINSSSSQSYRNIIKIDGATDGIVVSEGGILINNSIWSDGGIGQGVRPENVNKLFTVIANNVIEGFSGAGGVGFDLGVSSNVGVVLYTGNAAYDNTTNYTAPSDYVLDTWEPTDQNETLSASPFTDAANGDFSPVDTGAVKEGSLPADFGGGQ